MSPKTWIRPEPEPFTPAWIAKRQGEQVDYCTKCGRYCLKGTARRYTDDKRYLACPKCIAAMTALTFCETCTYRMDYHLNGACPTEDECR